MYLFLKYVYSTFLYVHKTLYLKNIAKKYKNAYIIADPT